MNKTEFQVILVKGKKGVGQIKVVGYNTHDYS